MSSRRLSKALGRQSDYSYDKEHTHGSSGRSARRRHSTETTRRVRRAESREARAHIADEL